MRKLLPCGHHAIASPLVVLIYTRKQVLRSRAILVVECVSADFARVASSRLVVVLLVVVFVVVVVLLFDVAVATRLPRHQVQRQPGRQLALCRATAL